MSYRVAVGNPFDGLDDENEDPKHRTPKPKMAPAEKASDAPKTVKAKPEAPASKAAATPASAPPTQKPAASAAVQKPADASLKKKPAARNPARRDGNSGAPRNENGDNAARRDYQKEKSYDRKDRGPRQEGAPRRGRQFDRHSGTGRPPTENKKGGSGAGNWGDETKEGIVAAEAKAAADAAGSPAAERDAEVAVTKKEDEAPKEPEGISFDEYLAKKAAPTAESLKIRSAGEGVAANKAWSSYTALEKDSEKDAAKPAPPKEAAKDVKEDATAGLLNFRIARDDGDRFEGGRGRGGRGRGSNRGSRGRGGRGEHSSRGRSGAAPAFNLTADFPSLAPQ